MHSENYFSAGGPHLDALTRIRRDYPLSAHGVGLSLGSAGDVDREHLCRLRELCRRFDPIFVSEHLSWGAVGGTHLNDLLPLPYTFEALEQMLRKVGIVQETLGRRILIENISSYVTLPGAEMPECEFLAELSRLSGCGVLLDVNNVYVSSCNHGFDPVSFLEAIPRDRVEEIHLAGHSVQRYGDASILVDTHSARVCPAVWSLYRYALRRFGPVPTLIEWDTDLPALEVLLAEAQQAEALMESAYALAA